MKRPKSRTRRLGAPAVLAVSYLAGAVPFTNITARALKGVDLRDVGAGTVSGTGLHQVAGFGPLAAAGCAELAKGVAGPMLARAVANRPGPRLGALAAGAALAGHNWSPFLRFQGGRGVAVALGASLATSPEAAVVLGLGLGVGRLLRQSGAGCAVAVAALPFVLRKRHGSDGLFLGLSLALPIAAKRLAGNRPPPSRDLGNYLHRLLFDSDAPGAGSASDPRVATASETVRRRS